MRELVTPQGGAMSVADAMTSAASRLPTIERDKRDDPFVVLIDGRRVDIDGRAAWASPGAAKGAVHRYLKAIRVYATTLQTRTTRDERAEWIAEHVKTPRLSRWRAGK